MTNSTWVCATDSFMSGWGPAQGRTNRYCVECDTREQVDQIERAMRARDEMKRITINTTAPKSSARQLVTRKHFNDLGEVWRGEVAKSDRDTAAEAFARFQGSGRAVADMCEHGDGPGRLYEHDLHIFGDEAEGYTLIIANMTYRDEPLATLERRLFDWARDEDFDL